MTEAAVEIGLLERATERARIGQAIERARSGRGAVVVVEGPPGIGKSALLEEGRRAAGGFTVTRARGGELERDFPWGVVRQLFERRVVLSGDREALLAGAAAHAAEPLGLRRAGTVSPESELAALHGLHWLVVNLSVSGPLLVVVDDLHWADAASERFIGYLARRVEELPVALLLARRPVDASHPDPAAEPGAVVVRPGELSAAAVRAVVGAAFADPDEAFAEACHRATGGNPFLVSELVAELRAAGVPPTAAAAARIEQVGPVSVARSVLRRLAGAPPGAEALAAAVAVLGTDADLRHAAALAQLDLAAAGEVADALAAAAVLRPGRPLEFVHPVLRAAVHDALPPARLAEAHARAARLLAADGAGPGRIAVHLLGAEAGGDAWALAVLREAAARALMNGAPEAAATFLRRALADAGDEVERTAVLRELGRAEVLAGDPSGPDRLRAALEATVDVRERAGLGRELGLALVPDGRYALAARVLAAAAEDAHRAGDADLALLLESDLASAGRLLPDTEPEARRRLEAIGDEGLDATPPGRQLLCSKSLWAVTHATAADAAGFARRGLAHGLPADPTQTNCQWDAVYALMVAEEHAEAEAALEDVTRAARARGSILTFARAACFRALLYLHAGRVADAEAEARSSIETAGERAWVIRRMATGVRAAALAEAARSDEAFAALRAVGAVSGPLPEVYMLAFLLEGRARARLAVRDLEGAAADLEELGRRESLMRGSTPRLDWRRHLAEVQLQRGDAARAVTLAEEELERARAWGTAGAQGAALRVAALTGADPEPRLREAVALLEGTPLRLEHARALVDLGAAVRRAGRASAARDDLRRGFELADRLGAASLAARARQELLASGARPRRAALSGVDALTASERRVATMAAEGMTNREIAQALFVTLRTVEVHLTHAYGKLGIGSRAELPAALS